MQIKDIPQVSALHQRVLSTATARMGETFLPYFYTTVVEHPSLHCALVATRGTQIVGCITATRDLNRTKVLLAPLRFSPKALIEAIFAILTQRVTLAEIYERTALEKELTKGLPVPYPTLLTLCVDKRQQGRGIGTALVKSAEEFFSAGTVLYVDTEKSNRKAQRFYEAVGFTREREVRKSVVYVKTTPKE